MVALLIYGAVIAHQLQYDNDGPTRFIVAGDHFVDSARLVAPITVMQQSAGYDGQFYYRLALDPFTGVQTNFGVTLDNPATRGARIGYPLLAWLASFGRPALVPAALIGVNLLGLAVIAWLTGSILRARGLPAWRGIVVPLYPRFMLTLVRDTTEIAAAAFALAALAFALRRRFWPAAALLSFAVITRETTLFYLAGFGIIESLRCLADRRWSWALVPLLVPGIVFVAWQSFIAWYWGMSSYSGTAQNLGEPFRAVIHYVVDEWRLLLASPWRSVPWKLHLFGLMSVAFCVAVIGLAGLAARWRMSTAALSADWLLYSALMVCLTAAVWVEPFDFLRAYSDCFVVSALLVVLSRQTWPTVCLLLFILPVWRFSLWYVQVA